ncbi:MAG: hypothetical protein ABR578_10675 [Chromatocurvus sp.]
MPLRALLRTCVLVLAVTGLASCEPSDPVAAAAERYVQLALSLDQLAEGEVDAWFGPSDYVPEKPLADTIESLLVEVRDYDASLRDRALPQDDARLQTLREKSAHLLAVTEYLTASSLPPLADELQTLYGASLPSPPDDGELERVFEELSALLPGRRTLSFRIAAYRNTLLISADRRRQVFERALQECRERTLAHWSLPASEQLELQWTRDVKTPWHSYQGEFRSVLQLNDLTLGYVGSVLDVACHEGYPGHHAQFVLYEQAGGGTRVEDQLVLLRSPETALREGAAELGVDLLFPGEDRLRFERDVLFPLAGLDPSQAATNLRITRLLQRLGPAVVPILTTYRDGGVTFNSTTFELERYALVQAPRKALEHFDRYGAYALSYIVARQALADWLAAQGEDQWTSLANILIEPDQSAIWRSEE